jgi:hypothetical protein
MTSLCYIFFVILTKSLQPFSQSDIQNSDHAKLHAFLALAVDFARLVTNSIFVAVSCYALFGQRLVNATGTGRM